MVRIEVVSFDMEGTIIDNTFSDLIWETDIPMLYGQEHGLDFETARERVIREYGQVGDERPEWYDTGYWFRRLGLPGDWRELLGRRRDDCRVYPEARMVLESLSREYTLIITSNTIISDFGVVKKSEDFYLSVCRAVGVQSEAMAHVGDDPRFDYEAPRRLGIHAYHLDRKGVSEGEDVVHDLQEFELSLRELERDLGSRSEA
jgi:FMN phosphatase YigB (HAD superfamily)